MEKRFLVGAKILGVIFILLATYLINIPLGFLEVYSPDQKNSASRIIYSGYQGRIRYIENMRLKYNVTLARSGKGPLLNKGIASFKQEAEDFKKDYIVQKKLPLHAQLVVSSGFFTCLLYLIVGFSLLLNFRWARVMAMGSMILSGLFYILFLYDLYSVINLSTMMNNEVNHLEALVLPTEKFEYITSWDNFKFVFLNISMWAMFLPLAVFALANFYYFTRPKVKEVFT